MYLSRLILNPRSRQVQRDLANPYELHRTLLRAFPTGPVDVARTAEGAPGVLFRIDAQLQTGVLALLVQSQTAPDWSHLPNPPGQPYLAPADPWLLEENPAVKARDLAFRSYQQLAFRLRANPTQRLSAGKGNKGKRIGIYAVDEQIAWLRRKGEQSGFHLLHVQTSRDEKIKLEGAIPVKPKPGQAASEAEASPKQKLEMLSVQFDGLLQVTDPDRFLAAVHAGIGSGKAFGFGLLSLARV
jgi:CRISPR system Cascade subunit CasE